MIAKLLSCTGRLKVTYRIFYCMHAYTYIHTYIHPIVIPAFHCLLLPGVGPIPQPSRRSRSGCYCSSVLFCGSGGLQKQRVILIVIVIGHDDELAAADCVGLICEWSERLCCAGSLQGTREAAYIHTYEYIHTHTFIHTSYPHVPTNIRSYILLEYPIGEFLNDTHFSNNLVVINIHTLIVADIILELE